MLKIFIFLLISLLVFLPNVSTVQASGSNINIVINGSLISTDVSPIVSNGRTLVPLRVISETLGANVVWLDDGRVNITKNNKAITLRVNQTNALIDDRVVQLEAAVILVQGRTMVPVRFIAEAFGAIVNWDDTTRVVSISGVESVKVADNTSPPTANENGTLSIGMPSSQLLTMLGVPDRTETSIYGFDWWVYNRFAGGVILAGVRNNSLVVFYTDSPTWTIGGVSPGASFASLSSVHSFATSVRIDFGNTQFTINLDEKTLSERPIVHRDDNVHLFYLDTAKNREVSAIKIMDVRSFLATIQWRPLSQGQPDFGVPNLTEAQKRIAFDGQERIMLDLVNSYRRRNNLNTLLPHALLAQVSREHSRDMLVNDYFAHESLDDLNPSQRISRANIEFRIAGENLAKGMPDAIGAHHGLLNSPGHRRIIETAAFTHLGIGIVERHYTQKFIGQ